MTDRLREALRDWIEAPDDTADERLRVVADEWLDATPAPDAHVHTPTSKAGDTNAYCSTCGYFPLPLDVERLAHRLDGPRLRCVVDHETWPCSFARAYAEERPQEAFNR